jgi:O-acetyl-ADP-ribose deacetylase (regulator of RNase III)
MIGLRVRAVSLALFCASLAAACAVKAPVETEWVATREGAEDLEAARRACKARAAEETKSLQLPGMGARAAGGIFISCMREKGWELREKLDLGE